MGNFYITSDLIVGSNITIQKSLENNPNQCYNSKVIISVMALRNHLFKEASVPAYTILGFQLHRA